MKSPRRSPFATSPANVLVACALVALGALRLIAADPVRWTLEAPEEDRVFQRDDLGGADVVVSGTFPKEAGVRPGDGVETRFLGDPTWTPTWRVAPGEARFRLRTRVPAGFAVLFVRVRRGDAILALAERRVHVGEVFVVAGQSNSANHGEERQRPAMPIVLALGPGGWRLAHDPQPGASGDGGSMVPSLGDALSRALGVPVGFVSCGSGGTSVREWLPSGVVFDAPPTVMARVRRKGDGWESDGALYQQLVAKVRALGPRGFRAVLWHQGESDANQADPTRTLRGDLYARFMSRLMEGVRSDAGWAVPWMVAQASYHTPDDRGSEDIRRAQASLWESGLALQGPDTDALGERWRDGGGRGVHFSGAGLREHGRLWAERLEPWLRGLTQAGVARADRKGRGGHGVFVPAPGWPALKAGSVETFLAGGRPAFVFLPETLTSEQPWVFYAPTLAGVPDEAERWMHEQFLAAGVAVAGVDVGEAYGSPAAHVAQEALHDEVRRRFGFRRKACVLGRSRGGLIVASWAAAHSSRVLGVAGIYPVFDLRSYPGLERAAGSYGMTPVQLEQALGRLNPVAMAGTIARAGIPALLVHGDQDKLVPLEPNTGAFVAGYESAGRREAAQVLVLPGRGHDMDLGFFRSRELVDFVTARAKARK